MTTNFESTCDDNGGAPNRRVNVLRILVGIVAMYVFSPAPLAWLFMKAGRRDLWQPMADVVYAPLRWVSLRFDVVGEFYDWQSHFIGW